jgi:hypothetical protein
VTYTQLIWAMGSFVDHCLSLCPFCCNHCIVCPSSKYGLWLLRWSLPIFLIFQDQLILLRVLNYIFSSTFTESTFVSFGSSLDNYVRLVLLIYSGLLLHLFPILKSSIKCLFSVNRQLNILSQNDFLLQWHNWTQIRWK